MRFFSQEWREFLLGIIQPGIGLKRWLALLVMGTLFVTMGVAIAFSSPVHDLFYKLLRLLTLGQLPGALRGTIFIAVGLAAILFATYRLLDLVSRGNRLSHGQKGAIATLYRRRRLESGPRIVAIGGGTGLSSLLRGLKHYSANITAIVAITDDGGSSGRLRSELGIPPPGDARACLVALSDAEPFVEELFTYRFNGGSNLGGHSLGNLMLAALSDMEHGFQKGLDATTSLLGLHGRVVPVSEYTDVVLMAETVSGQRLVGESAIGEGPSRIAKLWQEPRNVPVNNEALKAIVEADIIVMGPGSLYTSVLPNFLVPGMTEVVNRTTVPKVFVCNVATQWHETDGYGVADHLEALRTIGGVVPTHVLVNSNVLRLPEEWLQKAIPPQLDGYEFDGELVAADVVDEELRTRHQPDKLARAILGIAAGEGSSAHKKALVKA